MIMIEKDHSDRDNRTGTQGPPGPAGAGPTKAEVMAQQPAEAPAPTTGPSEVQR